MFQCFQVIHLCPPKGSFNLELKCHFLVDTNSITDIDTDIKDTNSITDIDTDIKGAFDSSKDKIVEQE